MTTSTPPIERSAEFRRAVEALVEQRLNSDDRAFFSGDRMLEGGCRLPEPSTHIDPRMGLTLADMVIPGYVKPTTATMIVKRMHPTQAQTEERTNHEQKGVSSVPI